MTKITKARESAYKILFRVFSDNAFVNLSSKNEMEKLDKKEDRALCHEIVFGVLQNLYFIDFVIKCFSKIRIKKISVNVLTILRLSIYQMYFLDKIPNSAAVNEGVLLSKKYAYKSSGFINAVLRAVDDKNKVFEKLNSLSEKEKLSIENSVPLWMIDIFYDSYGGEHAKKICESFSIRKRNTIRINSLKKSDLELSKGIFELPYSSFYDISDDISEIISKGEFYVQGLSSQICVDVLSPSENDKILDCCSAPGGKSFTSAQYMNNCGEIISCDIYDHKIKLISEGAEKLGISIINAEKRDMAVFQQDFVDKFDKVICDVPCSGFGIINKKPDIIFKNKQSVEEIQDLAEKILDNCSGYVKNGGELVFSTCTLNKGENEMAVEKFLNAHKEFKIAEIKKYNYDNFLYNDFGLTILPDEIFDGFFISRMIKG
ncbi:MAG: 16S rRNA (cytosine(967)-C(5))-methyltransferase RsmB [Clostridia bacterium]|nr:16S rRNA (cytosine(967)-C(5))-methyltransferase RsmB [Clostridia bacterium]